MKKIIFILTLFATQAVAQNQNNVWMFGDSAGIDFNSITNPIPITSGVIGRGSCVSLADSNGNLILYAATMPYFGPYTFLATKLFNDQNLILPGADSITGEAWYNELGLFPKPGDTTGNLYYVFSIGVNGAPNPGLYFTLIDMSLNGGLGGVMQENIQLDTIEYGDCLTTIKHGNGRDWWVIAKINNFPFTFLNRFRVYLVTPDSINGPFIQDFNDASDVSFQKIIWHPEYAKFMLINTRGYMSEFNFDRCSGLISLDQNIYPEITNFNRPFWGGAYSPNGNIFYTSRTSYGGNGGDYNYLLQYDLTAANIPLSCDTLDSTLYPIADCGDLRLAPDGKIYYTQAYPHGFPYQDTMRNYVNENLGVINNPDVVGTGCNFQPFSFYLGGKRTYYGLPNNPNYSLGPIVASLCDTLSTVINEVKEKSATIYISPNPATRLIYFNAQHLKGKQGILNIVTINGERVFQKPIEILNGGYATLRIEISSYPSGIYFVSFQTEKESVAGKFVKE
ncbi:MAG: T9SS type A sorting domain-containing protein [Bacteroidota bacterium]